MIVGCLAVEPMAEFFSGVGWTAEPARGLVRVTTPGGAFGCTWEAAPPRLELALSLRDPLDVEAVAELVEPAGGIIMEPLQETAWGGWGFSFNDPEGNTWELGSPWTVTAVDLYLSTGARPIPDGPIVALAVPRRHPATI